MSNNPKDTLKNEIKNQPEKGKEVGNKSEEKALIKRNLI